MAFCFCSSFSFSRLGSSSHSLLILSCNKQKIYVISALEVLKSAFIIIAHAVFLGITSIFGNIVITRITPALPLINSLLLKVTCTCITSCSNFSFNFLSSSSLFFLNLSWAMASLSSHKRCWVFLEKNSISKQFALKCRWLKCAEVIKGLPYMPFKILLNLKMHFSNENCLIGSWKIHLKKINKSFNEGVKCF